MRKDFAKCLLFSSVALIVPSTISACFYSTPSNTSNAVDKQEDSLRNIALIFQDNERRPINGVEVQFIIEGAPVKRETDDNGYVRTSIPTQNDIDVIAKKSGYETLELTIEFDSIPQNTPVYTLQKIHDQEYSIDGSIAITESQGDTVDIQLFDQNCMSINKTSQELNYGSLLKNNEPRTIFIGRVNYKELAYIATLTSYVGSAGKDGRIRYNEVYISKGRKPAEISCSIDSKFSSLQLSIGMDDSISNEDMELGLKIFLDGNLTVIERIGERTVKSLAIDVANANSLSLEVSCIRARVHACAPLSILDSSLE